MTETRTYWHIAAATYTNGEALKCWNTLAAEGYAPEWKWGDAPEGYDGDVICVFPDTPGGRTEADWLWYEHNTSHLLRIDVPADVHDDVITEVEEGYPAVWGEIPAEWITLVRTGYAEHTVTREGDSY